MRIPIVPGTDARQSYGDLSGEHETLIPAVCQQGVLVHMRARISQQTRGVSCRSDLLNYAGRGVHGIVLEAFGAGNMPV
jgi:hypothetical protein